MSIIEERRSIRKFTEQSLDEEQISQLIAKTAYAPSWKNCQPIRYIAVCDAALKQNDFLLKDDVSTNDQTTIKLYFSDLELLFLSDVLTGVELLGHMVVLFLIF